jgi:hypothetical protein
MGFFPETTRTCKNTFIGVPFFLGLSLETYEWKEREDIVKQYCATLYFLIFSIAIHSPWECVPKLKQPEIETPMNDIIEIFETVDPLPKPKKIRGRPKKVKSDESKRTRARTQPL